MSNKPLKLVILISGNGSNLQAIIDAIDNAQLNAKIAVVISNRADAYGLERAKKHAIPTLCLEKQSHPDRVKYDTVLQQAIDEYQPDLVILAGFMHILSKPIVQHYHGKMINIHPSLLPKYPGLDTYAKALNARDKKHGSTIHFVTEDIDGGPIIARANVDILANDTVDSLKQRVQRLEHVFYPKIIEWFCDKRIKLQNNLVLFDNKYLSNTGKQVTFDKYKKNNLKEHQT